MIVVGRIESSSYGVAGFWNAPDYNIVRDVLQLIAVPSFCFLASSSLRVFAPLRLCVKFLRLCVKISIDMSHEKR